jgi:hypothetical protein
LDRPNLGKINVARSVHTQVPAETDLAPDADPQFVIWANYIIRWNRNLVAGSKCRRDLPKQVFSVNLQELAGSLPDKLLELGRYVGRELLQLPLSKP